MKQVRASILLLAATSLPLTHICKSRTAISHIHVWKVRKSACVTHEAHMARAESKPGQDDRKEGGIPEQDIKVKHECVNWLTWEAMQISKTGMHHLALIQFHLHLKNQESHLTPCCSVWLWNPMDCSTLGFPVLHYLLEFARAHIHWVGDAIQPPWPLLPPSPPALNLSQHHCGPTYISNLYIQLLRVWERMMACIDHSVSILSSFFLFITNF